MDNLPNELKLSIFQYLDSFDVITLGNISNSFAPLSYDRKLVSNLHFCKDYRLTTEHWQMNLMHPLRQDVITSLNINCVYWISRHELRRCLCLPMLKSLYALDTTLSLVDICSSSSSIKLNVLALTIKAFGHLKYLTYSALKDIKKLCVHYDTSEMAQSTILRFLLHNCISLEELWFLDLSDVGFFSGDFSFLSKQFPNSLKILVLTCQMPNLLKDYNSRGLNTIAFQCKRGRANLYLENIDKETSDIYNSSFYEELGSPVWHTYFNQLRCDYPFGLCDAKKLVYNQETFPHIHFEELSLHHVPCKCCWGLQTSVLSILRLSNTKFLRKLSINTCIFNKSKGLSSAQVKSNFDELIEQSPFIEELEIWKCGLKTTVNPDMLRSIAKLSKLKKLAIDVPNIDDAKCILDICKICANLISLKISSQQDLDAYTCLRYLQMLKDFRYQQAYLPLKAILESLVSHDAHKLERLVLKCDRTDMLSCDIFDEFLIGNPQLKLLYIRVTEYSKADLGPISRYLNKFKLKQQIFIITNSDSDCLHLVPDSYMLEMVQFNTSIGVIDIFNSFH